MKRRVMAAAMLTLGVFASVGVAQERGEAWVLNRVRPDQRERHDRLESHSVDGFAARRPASVPKENRPVFLFTHDGNIETGRC